MGLFDRAKEGMRQTQEKAAARESISAAYLGGYGDHKKAKGVLSFDDEHAEFTVPLQAKLSFKIPNADLRGLAIEGRDEVGRRVTVTRLLATGIFAFALKKKQEEKESYVTLTLPDGQEAVFQIADRSPTDVKLKAEDPYVMLKKLSELKESGVITEAEYEAKKAQLLEQL